MADRHEEMRQNLLEIAEMNEHLVSNPPRTFREACQWNLWYQSVARMYNSSGSLGRLDMILLPYYEADIQAGRLTDEEAIFHIACHLVRDTAYIQLGGPDLSGKDATNPVSFLILEAAHRLKIPANIGVCVGKGVDPKLIRRGVEVLMEDRIGVPKFLGVDNTDRGLCRQRVPGGTGARARLCRLPLAGHSGARVCADGHRQSKSRRHLRSGAEGYAGGRGSRAQHGGTLEPLPETSAVSHGHGCQGVSTSSTSIITRCFRNSFSISFARDPLRRVSMPATAAWSFTPLAWMARRWPRRRTPSRPSITG